MEDYDIIFGGDETSFRLNLVAFGLGKRMLAKIETSCP